MINLLEKFLQPVIKGFIICFLISTLGASLMMTQEEMSLLNSVSPDVSDTFDMSEDAINNLTPAALPDILFVSAILYFNPTHWTVWINEKIYTAEEAEDDQLKLLKVTQHYVELELKDFSFKKVTRMRPNQSLVTVGRRVLDGDARPRPKPLQL